MEHPEFWSHTLRDDACERWSSPVRSQALANEHERTRSVGRERRSPNFKRSVALCA